MDGILTPDELESNEHGYGWLPDDLRHAERSIKTKYMNVKEENKEEALE